MHILRVLQIKKKKKKIKGIKTKGREFKNIDGQSYGLLCTRQRRRGENINVETCHTPKTKMINGDESKQIGGN